MEKKIKRRKFFIKKDFQGKLILGCFLFVTGGGLLFNVLLGMLSADTLTISYVNQKLQPGQTPFMLFKQVLTDNWLLLIVGGGFVMLSTLLLSHRIAGPLYRFETTLENMKAGALDNTINLRDTDQGKELARKINELNIQLSQSFLTISHNSRALEALIEQTSKLNLSETEKEELAGLCWAMQEHNRKIAGNCNYFTSRDE